MRARACTPRTPPRTPLGIRTSAGLMSTASCTHPSRFASRCSAPQRMQERWISKPSVGTSNCGRMRFCHTFWPYQMVHNIDRCAAHVVCPILISPSSSRTSNVDFVRLFPITIFNFSSRDQLSYSSPSPPCSQFRTPDCWRSERIFNIRPFHWQYSSTAARLSHSRGDA